MFKLVYCTLLGQKIKFRLFFSTFCFFLVPRIGVAYFRDLVPSHTAHDYSGGESLAASSNFSMSQTPESGKGYHSSNQIVELKN